MTATATAPDGSPSTGSVASTAPASASAGRAAAGAGPDEAVGEAAPASLDPALALAAPGGVGRVERAPAEAAWWLRAEPGVVLRAGVAPALRLRGDVGLSLGQGLRLSVSGWGGPPADLELLTADRDLGGGGVAAGLGWATPGRVSLRTGLSGGLELRHFREAGEGVAWVPMPLLALDLGVGVRVARGWALEPRVGATWDLRPTELVVPGHAPAALSPWAFVAGLAVVPGGRL